MYGIFVCVMCTCVCLWETDAAALDATLVCTHVRVHIREGFPLPLKGSDNDLFPRCFPLKTLLQFVSFIKAFRVI